MKKKIIVIFFLFFYFLANAQFEQKKWKNEGPCAKNLISYNYVGRIQVVKSDKKAEKIYFGSSTGGFWIYNNLSDSCFCTSNNIPGGINAIAINPYDSLNIFAAFVFYANGVKKSYHYTYGLYESNDGGNSWRKNTLEIKADDLFFLNEIIFDNHKKGRMYVLADSLIFVSNNFGKDWKTLKLKASKNEKFIDLIQLKDGNLVVAGENCLYFSDKNQNKWNNKTPDNLKSDCIIRISGYKNNIYAVAFSKKNKQNFFFSTFDKGNSFNIKNYNLSLKDYVIGIDVFNDSIIFAYGMYLKYSIDSGNTFKTLSTDIHLDIRDVLFIDEKDYKKFYVATDGGLFFTSNFGKKWKLVSTESLYQAYSIKCSQTDSCILLAGMHDNGTLMRNKNGKWEHILGGDGAGVAISDDESYIFAYVTNYLNLKSKKGSWKSTNIKTSLLGVNPIISESQKSVYVGGYSETKSKGTLIKIEDFSSYKKENNQEIANSWGVVSAIFFKEKPKEAVYFACANIWGNHNFNLQKVISKDSTYQTINLISKKSEFRTIISGITSANNTNNLWISFNSFDKENKVWFSADDGKTWENISYNLPNVPVYTIFYVEYLNILLIGNDYGAYYLRDENWLRFGSDMPFVAVTDFDFNEVTNTLYASTYGRGIWSLNLQD